MAETAWLYFLLTLSAVLLMALPAFRFVDTPNAATRYAALDGLRGFLAFTVFVFHVVAMRTYLETGAWVVPQQSFAVLLGPIGVSLFFMTTGFLFWGKLLAAKGHMNWHALYRNRLFRIAPMYLVAVIAMLLIVAAKTGFELREPAAVVALEVVQWLALGFFNLQPDVNGYAASQVLASVTWTISYEWAFYASLFFIALAARSRAHLVYVLAALALVTLAKMVFGLSAFGFAALFLSGMAVASLFHDGWKLKLSDRAKSWIALTCLSAIFVLHAWSGSLSGYGTVVATILAVFFYLVCSGASLFGLLLTRPAQRLGNISYSVYLLQGLALTLVFSWPPLKAFALASPTKYGIVAAVCSSLLIAVSSLTYYFIELPSIRFGKRSRTVHAAAAPLPNATLAAVPARIEASPEGLASATYQPRTSEP